MRKQLEKIREQEHRTRSELVREALRRYFASRYPEVTPTQSEMKAIRRGRAEIASGKYVTLEQLQDDLESTNRKPRTKSSRKAAR
jgi:predicted transcriptional regulator